MYQQIPTLLLKNIQEKVQVSFINERTPFYFISTVFLFITIALSGLSTFQQKENYSDFFPSPGYYYGNYIHDQAPIEKLCWYFSQITHHTILLLFFYFFLAFINMKSEPYFKMIAPLALTISVLYFYFLFPKQRLELHQLPFYNFFSHFMIIFLVFGEFMYIKDYTFKETTHCFIFILTCLCAIYINYALRGVWSYNLVKLDRYSGWSMVSKTVLVMYFFSFLFYFLKYKNKDDFGLTTKDLRNATSFFSGIIGILWFHWYTS
tara:strand:+ start:438 stop:1226 length:789 start_codon:yes stop_codon:yes gene_type:complete